MRNIEKSNIILHRFTSYKAWSYTNLMHNKENKKKILKNDTK